MATPLIDAATDMKAAQALLPADAHPKTSEDFAARLKEYEAAVK